MPREIWNEGRVVGLSTYEIYVKEFLSQNPTGTPASEREWIASSIASGASMLLKFPLVTPAAGTTDTAVTIPLPADTNLCAANPIVASFFHGDAEVDSSGYWGEYVTDYGELISNTASSSPTNPMTPQGENIVPTASSLEWTGTARTQLSNYLKLVDGIVIQPGTWSTASSNPPQKDLAPDLNRVPSVRFHVHGTIDTQFWVLLTGFTVRGVIDGSSGVDGSIDTTSPADGDFLGPTVFPWATKIIISLPSGAASSLLSGAYTRQVAPVASGVGQSLTVDDTPIIDLAFPSDYFDNNYLDSPIPANVSDIDYSGTNAAVLAAFPRYGTSGPHQGPRGLYSVRLNAAGAITYEPIDCHAPGTVKLYQLGRSADVTDVLQRIHEVTAVPNTCMLLADTDSQNELYHYYLDSNNNVVINPVAHTEVTKGTISGLGGAASYKYTTNISTGSKTTSVLAVVNDQGQLLDTSGSGRIYQLASPYHINWDVLQAALGNNGSIDVMGSRLAQLRGALEANTFTAGKQFAIVKSGNSVVLEEVAALPNFFVKTINCSTVNYSNVSNIYSGVRIDVFGFYKDNDPIVNTFGTLTAIATSNYSLGGAYNWFQPFTITASADQAEFDDLLLKLNPTGLTGFNMVKLACMPASNYRSISGNVDNGAPISNTMNIWTAYMNATNGTGEEGNKYDGIIYVRNSGSTQSISQLSVLNSMTLYNSTYRPKCRRTTVVHSGHLTWTD